MKSWIKAGLIGGLVISGWTLLITIFDYPLHVHRYLEWIIIYPATGALSVLWMSSHPTPIKGTRIGAFSGMVVGGIDLVLNLLITTSIRWGSSFFVSYYPKNVIVFLRETSITQFFEPGKILLLFGSLVGYFIISAATGALGGWIYVHWKPNGKVSIENAT